jgi:hypothetical protein
MTPSTRQRRSVSRSMGPCSSTVQLPKAFPMAATLANPLPGCKPPRVSIESGA